MKLDLSRSLAVPFKANTNKELIIIYLVAFGLIIFPNIINTIVSFIVQMGMGPIFAMTNSAEQITPTGIMVFGIAMVLMLIGSLIGFVAYIFPLGYLVETIHLEIKGHDIIMPPWEGNLKKIIFNGLKLIGILIIYNFLLFSIIMIPIIIILLLAFIISGGSVPQSDTFGPILGLVIFFVSIVFVLIIFGVSLLFPMIIVNFAAKNSFWAAFDFVTIFKKIFSNLLDYLLAIILAILYSFVLMIPIIVLCCTCVGIAFIPLLANFIFPIAVMNLFAQLYKEELPLIVEESEQ